MRDFMLAVADAFGSYDDRDTDTACGLNAVAAEFGITALKARKLLITAGVYSTALSRRIAELATAGYKIEQIMKETGLGRASVHSYLPYTKIPYNLAELSANAERIRLYRKRRAACMEFCDRNTSQKIACGKPESGKQEAPRLWGKRTANSSEIVHTVLGSLEAYLHSNPPDYRFQVESLLELLYYAFTEYNITESPEFKAKIGPLDRKLRDLAETDEAADEYMNVVYSLCAAYERQSYVEGIKVGARLMMEMMEPVTE